MTLNGIYDIRSSMLFLFLALFFPYLFFCVAILVLYIRNFNGGRSFISESSESIPGIARTAVARRKKMFSFSGYLIWLKAIMCHVWENSIFLSLDTNDRMLSILLLHSAGCGYTYGVFVYVWRWGSRQRRLLLLIFDFSTSLAGKFYICFYKIWQHVFSLAVELWWECRPSC